MGHGSVAPKDWDQFNTSYNISSSSTVHQVFTSHLAEADFLPVNIHKRECCETTDKPEVTPIIIALDGTGSMGEIPLKLIQGGLPTLVKEILKNDKIPNPQIMFMVVGDLECDTYPLQVTQFEANIQMAEQLKKLYLEGGGGGNGRESYPLAWKFATDKVTLDCLKNRKVKGMLFTIGDEKLPEKISKLDLQQHLGIDSAEDVSTQTLFNNAAQMYDVFHISCITHNVIRTYGPTFPDEAIKTWSECIGRERVLTVKEENIEKIPEIIISTVQMLRGQQTLAKTISAWDKSTQLVVKDAMQHFSSAPAVQSGVYRPSSLAKRQFGTVASSSSGSMFNRSFSTVSLPTPPVFPTTLLPSSFKPLGLNLFTAKPLVVSSLVNVSSSLLKMIPK